MDYNGIKPDTTAKHSGPYTTSSSVGSQFVFMFVERVLGDRFTTLGLRAPGISVGFSV